MVQVRLFWVWKILSSKNVQIFWPLTNDCLWPHILNVVSFSNLKVEMFGKSKNVVPGQFHFSFFVFNKSLSNLSKRHLELFLCQMGRVKSYLEQLICFQNEKNSKFKKRRAGTVYLSFFYSKNSFSSFL